MPANYDQVLRDLDEQVSKLEAEIATLKAGRPTIVVLRNKYADLSPNAVFGAPTMGVYSQLGPTDAIPHVLKGQALAMTTQEIADKLLAGGVKSNAQDFTRSVSATLGQLRDKRVVVKVGDGWRLKTAEDRSDIERQLDQRAASMREMAAVTFSPSV